MSQFFQTKRFLPLFITQFLGAFNDNLFKNALVILFTYKIATSPENAAHMTNMAFALFILPSILFSGFAGKLADKIDRARIARATKFVEIILAVIGGAGLVFENTPLLLLTLFGFGVHSAFFGPVKYAMLPQHLKENELISGNGFIEAGTFIAILTGTILGGVLISLPDGALWLTIGLIVVAVVGYIASRNIPVAPAPLPDMKVSFKLWTETKEMMKHSFASREVFLCILGISWFWFVGAIFLAQFSPFVKNVLHAEEHVVTLFLAVFSIGIALGSALCGAALKGRIHANYVPFAALGMSAFGIDLYAVCDGLAPNQEGLLSLSDFLQQPYGLHCLLDLLGLSVCGGFFVVPLYTLLQRRADHNHGARAIASNNFLNALFMVGSAIMAMAMVALGFSIPQIFLATSILNILAALYICQLLPFSIIGAVLKFLYRVEVKGLEHYEAAGKRVLIVANHTSFLDAALLAAFLPDRVTFAIHTFIAREWWIKPMLKLVDTFSIDPTNPLATKSLIDVLKQDRKVMIFPEGRITVTGALMKIFEGPGMIADKSGAMIVPIRIDGAVRSPFSYMKGKIRIELFPKITLTILPPRQFTLPENVMGRARRKLAGAQLYDLMSEMMYTSSPIEKTLMATLLEARRVYGGSHKILEDQNRQPIHYRALIAKCFVLAGRIRRAGFAGQPRIGVMLPNVMAAPITFFAVQALGKVAALMNYTASPAQVLSAARAADLKTIITSEKFVTAGKLAPTIRVLEEAGIAIHYLEIMKSSWFDSVVMLAASIIPETLYKVSVKSNPDDAAVMLFTSGSEGTPKGVQLSHKNILANRFQLGSRIDFNPQDVVFNALPMFHAFGLTGGTLLPLLAGIKTFFYPSPLHYRVVPELVYDSNATILFGTDTFLAGYARFANPYDFYSLRYVFAGAERLKDETRKSWVEKFGLRILEGYGSTETSPVISANTPMHYRAGTVGRLMPGMNMRLDEVPGIDNGKKLSVSGQNVMMGYMKDDMPGVLQPLCDGWYDTGDIVDVDIDGFITIRGRTKRFAKIAGEMISLTAVETVINKVWPDKAHAVVSIPDARKGEALVLITEYAQADVSRLLEQFRANGLTELAVPKKQIIVDKLPLLGTGKTDYVKARELALASSQ